VRRKYSINPFTPPHDHAVKTVVLNRKRPVYLLLDYSFGPRTANLSEEEGHVVKKLLTLLLMALFAVPLSTVVFAPEAGAQY
jgi:hypothetical protein